MVFGSSLSHYSLFFMLMFLFMKYLMIISMNTKMW
ncbi:unnamed protein product [Schistosoma mattheei]|uniref:Uncharacterized protein n=2 Tax=Schistosoma TaxID=6181 RepID=A0A3P8A7N7_9TREM|nr:unnamed protein product [Schistosoma margrebowiei]VDP73578.1 unnamed protein product [Schistosoma mattheei]